MLDYRIRSLPEAVAIGDLNGDGKPDLATANNETSTASVLLNSGDGKFQPELVYPTAAQNGSVAIADFNGDRKLDLATANPDNDTVSVLLNTTGLCTVPKVKGKTLPRAKWVIARAHCRLGKVRWAYSKIVESGRVISERPKPATVLRRGGKVNLVVSRGRKR
jgi:hypothetical protein